MTESTTTRECVCFAVIECQFHTCSHRNTNKIYVYEHISSSLVLTEILVKIKASRNRKPKIANTATNSIHKPNKWPDTQTKQTQGVKKNVNC